MIEAKARGFGYPQSVKILSDFAILVPLVFTHRILLDIGLKYDGKKDKFTHK